MNTAEQLARLIMDADLPKRLSAENAQLRRVLADAVLILELKFGKEAKPGSVLYEARALLTSA